MHGIGYTYQFISQHVKNFSLSFYGGQVVFMTFLFESDNVLVANIVETTLFM